MCNHNGSLGNSSSFQWKSRASTNGRPSHRERVKAWKIGEGFKSWLGLFLARYQASSYLLDLLEALYLS